MHSFYQPDVGSLSHHVVCIGQTGSGKTGLITGLIEVVSLARKAVLVIDPKGDLTNLILRFPGYPPIKLAMFLGGDLVAATAASNGWRAALAGEGRDPDGDVAAWIDRVDVQILTPGALIAPVDVVGPLLRCPPGLADDADGRQALVSGSVSALLSLVGEPSHPLRDAEAILVAQILTDAWASGEVLDLGTLLQRVVDPPFPLLGKFPVDRALPPKAREALALKLNHLIAAPAFSAWTQGVPLDPGAWLTVGERAPVCVVTLAHLSDSERSFFLTLLLHAVVAWTRTLPGTDDLRALVVVDEVYGLLPPHPKDPPTKGPLMTLFKQARAVGVGVVACTQNPVDVDHKALSNCGTWIVGRLTTENDRSRVIEGLGGEAADLHRRLQALPHRGFLVRDRLGRLSVVRSPQTLSWLRGPLTRRELAALIGTTPRTTTEPGPPVVPAGLEVAWWMGEPWAGATDRWEAAIYAQIEVDGALLHRVWWPADARGAPVDRALDEASLSTAPGAGRYGGLPAWLDAAGEPDAFRAALSRRFSAHAGAAVRRLVLVWVPPKNREEGR